MKTILMGYEGKTVTLFCTRYIYTGKLVAMDDLSCTLEDPSIVYETGSFDTKDWQDAQRLPEKTWAVMLHSIESFGILK